jgi:diaminohydroxyphosphoribosylaminopyrimidine deaminase/5-amino-6-(5-phosphoribosylamino)uracil reductase
MKRNHPWTSGEQEIMRRALRLARRGEGRVEPNPMVGAVIVRAGRIVGEGYHRRFGGPHAEIVALEQAGRSARGAILFSTLEPCCHHGKTGPCTEAIRKAGIREVVAAVEDPNPRVRGRGLRELRRSKISVRIGLSEEEARRLNAPYWKWVKRKLPYVIAKWAMSADGKIADEKGNARWISGPEARKEVHELRGKVDAILCGIGTVLYDDPELTCRTGTSRRTALRVVADTKARLPLRCRLIRTLGKAPLLAAVGPGANRGAVERMRARGVEIWRAPAGRGGIHLKSLLAELARRGCMNLLVESGGQLTGQLLKEGWVDEVRIYVAPLLLGGERAPSVWEGEGRPLADALQLKEWSVRRVGKDLCLQAVVGTY